MSQHDYSIEGGSGAAVRANINLALPALAGMNNGPVGTLPAMFPDQVVADTTSGYILKRNHSNSDWDYIAPIDQRLLASAVGTSAYAVTHSPALTSYRHGMIYQFVADVDCSASPTLALSGMTAKGLKRHSADGTLVAANAKSILANQVVQAQYNSISDCLVLLNPANPMPGQVVQVVRTTVSSFASSNAILNMANDTVPQNTAGSEYFSLTITPKSATNKLLVEVDFGACASAAAGICVALFKDSVASAIAAMLNSSAGDTYFTPTRLAHYMTAGTVSPITFKVRAGCGSGQTLYFNGWPLGRLLGGVYSSGMTITEIQE